MTAHPKIPAWQIERYRLGELPAEETAVVKEALAADADSRARLDELVADDARVLEAHPPHLIATSIRARLDAESSAVSPSSPVPLRLVGALAAAVCFVALLPAVVERRPEPETRLKGLAPSLLVFRESAPQPEPLAPLSSAHEGEVVQLAYQAAGKRYGVVISIDGRGHVTRHLPRTGQQAARLETGAPVPLPEAYQLDDAPGFERFLLVTGDEAFAVDAVMRAAERLYGGGPDPARTGTRLDLPKGLDQFRFELRKEGSR
jgi:anti-sigma factor RsiW